VFDFLKGGKAELKVTLDRPRAVYNPGDTIHAVVRVEGVKDLKIQSAKIALVSLEEYEYRYEGRDADGDRETRKSKTTDEYRAWENQFLGETTVKGGTDQTYEFDLPLPPDAGPTVEGGKILNFSWLVKTTLDRRMASDVEDKQTIYVLSAPDPTARGAGEFGFANEPAEAEMRLRLPGTAFLAGDTISGELVIRPQKEFDVTEIRVELERLEVVPRDEGNQHKENQVVKLAGGTKLIPGQELILPFQLKIPPSVPITSRTRHGSIDWTVRGVLARRMRKDVFAQQEILLYSAPAS
jgi:sporulation-control protein spo0M